MTGYTTASSASHRGSKASLCSRRRIQKAAAAELRRCVKELGFCGGLLPSVTNNRMPLYGSPVFHEIYDEAQRLDVPLAIHGGVSQNLGLDRVCSFLEAHMLEHPVGLFLQITNMMFQGVFQEFPKLRIAYLEAGAGWVPFMMDRMEEDYEKFAARLAPHLKNPPSHFFKSGNIFVTMEVEERTAPYVVRLAARRRHHVGVRFSPRARTRPVRRRPAASEGAQRSVR